VVVVVVASPARYRPSFPFLFLVWAPTSDSMRSRSPHPRVPDCVIHFHTASSVILFGASLYHHT